MYSIQSHDRLVLESCLVKAINLLPHEEVVEDRLTALITYLETLKPYAIIPSILVCNKSNVIIDGHHRFYALQKLGFETMPVTYINYDNNLITPDLGGFVSKKQIIEAAIAGKFMPPKTSFHHVTDFNGVPHPLILLSVLFKLDMK